jgi:hypothetical protein
MLVMYDIQSGMTIGDVLGTPLYITMQIIYPMVNYGYSLI